LLPPDCEKRLAFAEDSPPCRLPSTWEPFAEAYDLLGDTSLLGVDLPGHTLSQLGMGFRDRDGKSIFLVGDACWKIEALEENRPPAAIAYRLFDSAGDYDETFAKLRRLHGSGAGPALIPSHCATTWKRAGGARKISR
jgi:glyoxylase-like metal-dependent hydrolase (beta-lactamase superfamily II)